MSNLYSIMYDKLVSEDIAIADQKEDMIQDLSELFNELTFLESNGNSNDLFIATLQSGGYINNLYPNLADSILVISNDSLNTNELLTRINSWNNSFTGNELIAYSTFKSVTNASNDFWSSNGIGTKIQTMIPLK